VYVQNKSSALVHPILSRFIHGLRVRVSFGVMVKLTELGFRVSDYFMPLQYTISCFQWQHLLPQKTHAHV